MEKTNVYLLLATSLLVYPYTNFCMKKPQKTIKQNMLHISKIAKEIPVNKKFDKKINSVERSKNLLFVRFDDNSATLINLNKSKTIENFNNLCNFEFIMGGKFLFIQLRDRSAKLINLTGNKFKTIKTLKEVNSFEYRKNKNLLLIKSSNYPYQPCDLKITAKLFSLQTNKPKHIKTFENGRNYQFSKKDNFLSIKLCNKSAKLIRLIGNKPKIIKTFENVQNIEFCNEKFLLVEFKGDSAQLINLKNNVVTKTFKNIWCSELNQTGNLLCIKFNDKSAKLINLNNLKTIKTFKNIDDLTYNKYDNFIAVTNIAQFNNNTITLMHLKDHKLIAIKKFNHVHSFEFSPEGNFLYISFNNNSIELISLKHNQPKTVKKFENTYYCRFDQRGNFLSVLFANNPPKLIHLKHNKTIVRYSKNNSYLPNNNILWLRQEDGLLRIFQLFKQGKNEKLFKQKLKIALKKKKLYDLIIKTKIYKKENTINNQSK
ncbi:hypothetical protein ACFLYU_01170 [Candidatus Dependentiae bacterium]